MLVCARVGTHTTLEIGERTVAAFGTNLLESAMKKGLLVAHVIPNQRCVILFRARECCFSRLEPTKVCQISANSDEATRRQGTHPPSSRWPPARSKFGSGGAPAGLGCHNAVVFTRSIKTRLI